MRKGKGKSAFFLILLIGVIMVIASYNFVYKKYTGMAKDLQASNDILQARVNTLKVYYDNRETYKADMEKYLGEVADVLTKYPADVKYEDVIMQATTMQLMSPIDYESIAIGGKESILSVDEETIEKMNKEEYPEVVSFEVTKSVYTNIISYDGLKQAVQQIFNNPNRIAIDSITYTMSGYERDDALSEEMAEELEENQDGMGVPSLTGAINLSFYNVSGTSKVYQAPSMLEYESGLANIFGAPQPIEVEEE